MKDIVIRTNDANYQFYIGNAYQLHANGCYAKRYASIESALKAVSVIKRNQRINAKEFGIYTKDVNGRFERVK